MMDYRPKEGSLNRNEELSQILREIRQAVREHRDQVGDYRCWVDDEVLYHRVLPELRGLSPQVPDPVNFSNFCDAYFNNRQDPSEPPYEIPLDSSVGKLELKYDSSLDGDIAAMDERALGAAIDKWYALVRAHRDKGHMSRGYEDDKALYLNLPERSLAKTRLPPRELFLGRGCPAYNAHCQTNPSEFAKAEWKK